MRRYVAAERPRSELLIDRYLRELRVSAWNRQLPRSQAVALESDVRANIDAALDAAGNDDEATVQRVLDRLGPPGAFVARLTAEPRSDLQRAIDTATAPIVRLGTALRVRGWGVADIGGLLLLIIGPFYVWWMGPIFGIILVRAAAERWSDQAMHRATVIVASLLAIQAVMALALFGLVLMGGGSAAEQLQRLFSMFAPGGAAGLPLAPQANAPGGVAALSPIEILIASPAFIAGVGSGLYLALSPRQRR